jgi:TrmH family RNA methyltransferase
MKTLTSAHHPLVKHMVKLRQERAYRYAEQSVVVEGVKPVQEIVPHIKRLFYTEAHASLPIPAAEKWLVSSSLMDKMSGMVSSEGIIAEVQMPPFASLEGVHWIVALDGISDPGNLGTLLRTALALGWQGVYLLPGSCDPFNEKAMRAARGAHFRLPIRSGTAEELERLIEQNKLQPLVADLMGTVPQELSKEKGRLLVLGNEAHGARPEVRRLCSPVTIAMPGEMESLNVAIAGGILMYELRKNGE